MQKNNNNITDKNNNKFRFLTLYINATSHLHGMHGMGHGACVRMCSH